MGIDATRQNAKVRGRGRNKCFWTHEKSKVLIESLQELACDPLWKADCGFKSNYMVELHKRILVKLPNFGKQVSPHIDSKLKWLKAKYHAIIEMLKESGCTWNVEEHKIQCEKQWYDDWIKRHKEAKGIWDLSFPCLNDLEIVYGRDRATGQSAEGFGDTINNIEVEEQEFGNEFEVDETNEVVEENSSTEIIQTKTGSTSASRKHKQQGTLDRKESKKMKATQMQGVEAQIAEATKQFSTCVAGLSSHFATMANAMANEDSRAEMASTRRNMIMVELSKLGMAQSDVFRAADILSTNETKLNIFSQLDVGAKFAYILSILYPLDN